MRTNALEDQETGFQCGDADDNDEGRYILFYFSLAKFTWYIMRKLKNFIGGFYYENKTWFNFCMDEKWSVD